MPNPLARAAETIAPARLGRSFRLLLVSSTITNIGDGIALAAGPLLVASQTRDPLLVSMAFLAQNLPVLLFGLHAGAVADRVDRRRLIALVNVARAVVLAALAVTIVTEAVSIAIVLSALFVLGTTETYADVGSQSLLPRLVHRRDLGIANARLQGASLLMNGLVAPPVGAALFAAGMAIPFVLDSAGFLLGAVIVSRLVYRREGEVASAGDAVGEDGPARAERESIRAEIAEGLRWLRHHPPMRTLALTIVAFNVTFGAAWSVLVLYAQEQLGMSDVGYGLVSTAMAVGGLAGSFLYGRLERRFSLADIMRVGLLIETATHLVLAVTTLPAVALATFTVFGAHAFVWGTTATAVRQRAVPDELLGRVTGVYHVGVMLGLVVGTPIGGWLASSYGIAAPFWFGFVGSAVLVTVMWRQFDHIVHAGDDVPHGTQEVVAGDD